MASEYGCKVCRVLGQRDLGHYDERLLALWKGEGSQRKGYRELAEWLNVTLLRREMDKAGLPTLGEEAASKYERLRSDGTTSGEIADILEREGIDVDRLTSDFVSYGVIRTHITECLDEEYEAPTDSGWEDEAIQITRGYASDKIREAVASLINKGSIAVGTEPNVQVTFELECPDCQSRVPLRRARRQGRICHCESAKPADQ